MNFRAHSRTSAGNILSFTFLACLIAPAAADPLNIDPRPLFLVGSVDPNIMLMVDNSGSMSNIVPDVPYDPDVTYLTNCPTTNSNRISSGTQVELRVSGGTPRIRVSGSDYLWGTGSDRRCFVSDEDYLAKLNADSPIGTGTSNYLRAQYSGNFLNWYFNQSTDPTGCANTWSGSGKKPCTKTRMEIAKTASKALIDDLEADSRIGLCTYNGGSGGSLREAVAPLTTAKRETLKNKIDSLSPSGATPLAETLSDIGRYFAMRDTPTGSLNQNNSADSVQLTLHPGETNETTQKLHYIFGNGDRFANGTGELDKFPPPIEYFCQKSFAVLLTDGRPQVDQTIASYLEDYDGDCESGCESYDRKPDREYESHGSDYLDDVAKALYEMDLRPDLSDPNGLLDDKNNVTTFTIGFADDQVINDPLMQDTADNGGGLFLPAGDEQTLIGAFDRISGAINEQRGSAAALAANSTSLNVGAIVFQALFDSSDWSGDLIAYPIDLNGQVLIDSPYWTASSRLTDHTARTIYTFNSTVGAGVDFFWGNLDSDQQTALNTDPTGTVDAKGADRLAWLRGDHSKEARNSGGEFRNRVRTLADSSQQEWILGDIVNSDPVFVHEIDYGYQSLGAAESATYSAYLSDKADSLPSVFVGANDGMLHVFRADVADANSGNELFAYVPNAVYENLSELSTIGYTHEYFVDGSPRIGDVYFDGAWHTVLVSGLNGGGDSIFALDVTEYVTNPTANPSASDVVMWERSDPDDPADTDDPSMGLTFSQPQIGRLNNGTWAAIFGNGYNSPSEQATLYIVDIKTGVDIVEPITTGPAGSNGLSTPALFDYNGDKIVDYVYAGDLQGNLWKFDLTSASPSSWAVAYSGQPLFTATSPTDTNLRQPITVQPTLGAPPTITPAPTEPGVMVYFGTGRYLQTDDVTNTETQTFYGIWDDFIDPTDRSELQAQTITSEVDAFGARLRVTSNNTVAWETQRGWYMDLTQTEGERVVARAQLRYDRVIFLTVIPSSADCEPGGTSWLMELDALTGASFSQSVFDLNNDSVFDVSDMIDGDVATGYQVTVGIAKPPAWFEGPPGGEDGTDRRDFKVVTGTTGGIETVGNRRGGGDDEGSGGGASRSYWLQIQ